MSDRTYTCLGKCGRTGSRPFYCDECDRKNQKKKLGRAAEAFGAIKGDRKYMGEFPNKRRRHF